jgi:hypothetical protein
MPLPSNTDIKAPTVEASPHKPSRWRRIGRFFVALYPFAHYAFPLIAAIITVSYTYILVGPVLNRSGDNMYHLLNEFAIARGLLGGDNPLGPVAMEFGQPVLRFYQAFYYLFNIGMFFLAGIDIKTMHNVTIVICFALSPFAYMYFLQKLGLPRFAAGIGAMCSMLSIAAFGNSFEAYHQAGIVTQSMGGLFFPWFVGHFIGMLRGENRAATTALLFALAFISHAIMSVFAVIAGALYFAVASSRITLNGLKKLAVFCVVGVCLVAFWVLPFIEHTQKMRPVPDSIIRSGVHWFTSVSKDELTMVLFSGRLLDDPPRKGEARNKNDEFMDKISIIHAVITRPPVVSILTALGFLVALFRLRRLSNRFLLSGFLFSLFLFAGPDDYPWLRFFPFMKNIQTFRCTYLVEFFAFGLVGTGIEAVMRRAFFFAWRRRKLFRVPLTTLWVIVLLSGTVGVGIGIGLLGNAHLRIRDVTSLDAEIDALGSIPDKGRPYRVMPKFPGRYKLRQGWYSVNGYIPYCTHWKGTGPTAALHLCGNLAGNPVRWGDLHALAGARWFHGTEKEMTSLINAKDSDGAPLLHRLPNGRDRRGRPNDQYYVLDTGRDHFLRPLVGEPLPVVCTYAQWIWLVKSWTARYRDNLREESTPVIMKVPSGTLKESGLLDHARALLYLDRSGYEKDRRALHAFSELGGVVMSSSVIPGVPTTVPDAKSNKRFWADLPPYEGAKKPLPKDHLEELDPGFDIADVTQLSTNLYSVQDFVFDVDTLESLIAVLPMQAAPGWGATLDGEPLSTFATGPDMVGMIIPEGAHRLEVSWKMPWLGRFSSYLSAIGLLFVLAVWLWDGARYFRRRRRAQKPAEQPG